MCQSPVLSLAAPGWTCVVAFPSVPSLAHLLLPLDGSPLDLLHPLPCLALSMDLVPSMGLCPPCLGAVGGRPTREDVPCTGCALGPCGSLSLQGWPALAAPWCLAVRVSLLENENLCESALKSGYEKLLFSHGSALRLLWSYKGPGCEDSATLYTADCTHIHALII